MASKFCKNYRGMHQIKQCKAGVVFTTLEHYGTKEFRDSCPCFSSSGTGSCEFKTYPTAEEMAEDDRRLDELVAREVIIEECGEWVRGRSSEGYIDCPVCGGIEKLRYVRSGSHGEIHARCSSDGCVSWMDSFGVVRRTEFK